MKIALIQMNPTVGDIQKNVQLLYQRYSDAIDAGVDLVVSSELALTGYSPADMLEDPSFMNLIQKEMDCLAKKVEEIPFLVGTPWLLQGKKKYLGNAACLLTKKSIKRVFFKTCLPNYDVFDEKRYFYAETQPEKNIFKHQGLTFGVTICEDIWDPPRLNTYEVSPTKKLSGKVDCLLNMAASPYEKDKNPLRIQCLKKAAKTVKAPLLYVNQWGGQDEVLFGGHSMVFSKTGEILQMGKYFENDLLIHDLNKLKKNKLEIKEGSSWRECEKALVIGIRDYAKKSGFSQAVIGLSGGIDSALVTVLAVKALGAENVYTYGLPSKYSSKGSVADARVLAKNLEIPFDILSIKSGVKSVLKSLKPLLGKNLGLAEENAQARLRGLYLMAIANHTGRLLLTTGNKSEVAVGYCTLYGDMNGALNPIGDLYKTEVYALAKEINAVKEIIPLSILDKAPSAELRFDQRDSDSLPDYSILDPVLRLHLEEKKNKKEIMDALDVKEETVEQILRMTHLNEYKRFQSPPILKVSPKAFGIGRRFPLAKKFTPHF